MMNWLILLGVIQKKWRNAVDIIDKNLQGRQFIVINLTRAKEDPLYVRLGWNTSLELD